MAERYHLYTGEPAVHRPAEAIMGYWEPKAKSWHRHDCLEVCFINLVRESLQPYVSQIGKDKMVLDIAAGANNSVYYPPGFDMSRVLAVDISQPALDLNSSGHKLHADVRQPLKLQDSSFDLTLSVYGMRYFENQEAVILEMLRVTKPEAWVVMIDLFNAVNKDAVRRFDVRQLTTFIAANTNVVDLHTERLHQGCNIESSIDLLAIQKLAPSSNFT